MITKNNTSNYYFNPIFDPCPVEVKGQDGHTASLTFSRSTKPVSEWRVIHDKTAEFDLGPYMRSSIEETALGTMLVSTNSAAMLIAVFNVYMGLAAAGADGSEDALHFLPLFGTLRDGEKMTEKRVHFYNPNFPARLSGISYSNISIMVNGTSTAGGIKSVGLNDNLYYFYYDTFGHGGGDVLVEVLGHIEPTKETAVEEFDKYTPQSWTDKRTEYYLRDCRTEGACLRFFDHFGFAQTLVLDISGTSRNFAEQTREGFEGQSNRYNENFGYTFGSNIARSVSVSEVIHAGLNAVPEELFGDLCDLVASPVVLLYNKTTEHWERVRVTCNSITRDEKRHKLSADIDIVTTPINTFR